MTAPAPPSDTTGPESLKAACPVCGRPFERPATGPCPGCRTNLTDPAVEHIQAIDERWRALVTEREALLSHLMAARPTVPEPAGGVAESPAAPHRAPRHEIGVPTLLALGGVALLTAAAVVFTAVTWSTLSFAAQAAILFSATVLAGTAAVTLHKRSLPTAAAAFGVVTMSFAAVDVVGLERSGLLGLGDFTVPAAAVVAVMAGWVLSRTGLRWVTTAAAAGAVVGAVSLTGAVDATGASPAAVALTGILGSAAACASALLWRTRPAQVVAAVGGASWLVISTAGNAWALAEGDTGLAAGLLVASASIGLLLGAARRSVMTIAPATLLVVITSVGVAGNIGATELQLVAVAAGSVALIAWPATVMPGSVRLAAQVGCGPPATAIAAVTLYAAASTWARLGATVTDETWATLDPWAAATAALAGAALLSLPQVRLMACGVVLPAAVVASGALPTAVAWPVLLAVAVGAGAVPTSLRAEPVLVLATAAVAIGWAADASWSVTVAAGITTGLAVWLAVRTNPARRRIASGVAATSAGLALGAAAHAAGSSADVALGVGVVAAFAGAVAVSYRGIDDPPIATPIVAGLVSVVAALSASSEAAAGTLLLVAAAGWLAVAVVGWRPARWVTSVAASVGTALLLSDAGVDIVEAYTIVPAATLTVAGIWWLREDPGVGTALALSPALTLGLMPSLVALSSDPRALGRTLAVTGAAGILAVVGVRVRWLALAVASGAAAVWVAATQLAIVVEVVPRWVTFGVVGLLLVWLAATYERQQERRRTVARHLAGYR